MRSPAMKLLLVAMLSLLAPGFGARADSQAEADQLCAKAGRNHAIFELLLASSKAEASPVAGVVGCSWAFAHASSASGKIDLIVKLTTNLLPSEAAAMLAMKVALLPENNRGKTVEALPRMGDGGVYRTTVENGVLREIEIEAVKGRRRFVMTFRPGPDRYTGRLVGQSISFMGIGLSDL
jgi:hypothetical protein